MQSVQRKCEFYSAGMQMQSFAGTNCPTTKVCLLQSACPTPFPTPHEPLTDGFCLYAGRIFTRVRPSLTSVNSYSVSAGLPLLISTTWRGRSKPVWRKRQFDASMGRVCRASGSPRQGRQCRYLPYLPRSETVPALSGTVLHRKWQLLPRCVLIQTMRHFHG